MFSYHSKPLLVLALSAALFSPYAAHAAEVLAQNFDEVVAPALPSGWASQSLAGAQTVITSTTSSSSTPNAAFIPAPNITSDTALLFPPINISTGSPTHQLFMDFKFKRGTELNYDGAVLEISINGAPFVDVTSATIGGVFELGGYNVSALNNSGSSNPLKGRPAWSGTGASFETGRLSIPSLPSDTPYRLRFRVGTDSIIGASGFYVDSIRINVPIDAITEIVPSRTVVKAGDPVSFSIKQINPSSERISNSGSYLTLSSGDSLDGISIINGVVNAYSSWTFIIQQFSSIEPFSYSEFDVFTQTSTPPHAGAILKVTETPISTYLGAEFAVAFLSSSSNLPELGLSDVPVFNSGTDLCSGPLSPVPAGVAGSLLVATSGSCTVGQQALNAQSMGAAALLSVSSSGPVPYPSTEGSPYIVEPATPGLTIPAFVSEPLSAAVAGWSIFNSGPPGTVKIQLKGKNTPLRRTMAVNLASLSGEDLYQGNNMRAALVEVYVDADADGTPDDSEACPADPAKQAAGACGCGVADVDSNANGIFDCQKNLDVRKDVEVLRSLVQSLSLSKYSKQKSIRNKTKAQRNRVLARLGEVGITTSTPSINLTALGTAMSKPISKLLKNSSNFAANRKAALKALNALRNGIAAA